MTLKAKFAAILLLCIGLANCSFGQLDYNPQALLPFSPAYKTGVLDNGIKYIIRKSDNAKGKAFLYAFFNVGSIQEEPNEYGLAHLLEHLVFYGRKNLGDYQGYNAGTAMQRTEYSLSNVSTQRASTLDSSFSFLKDLALTFKATQKDLDKERKVVLEEWRLHQNEASKMGSQINCFALKDSRYARPNGTLGDTITLNQFTVKDAKRFREKWYRPDHLTIIAIGDFDASQIEIQIQKIFGSVRKAKGTSPRVVYPIPDYKEPIIAIASEVDAHSSEIEIHYKHPRPSIYTQEWLCKNFMDRMTEEMFNKRMQNAAKNPKNSFKEASFGCASLYFYSPDYNDYYFNISTKEQNVKSVFQFLLTENQRINQYGFSETELKEVKEEFLKRYKKEIEVELPYDEYFSQCFYYILQGKTPFSFLYFCQFAQKIIPQISLAQVNQHFKDYTKNIQPLISLTCPTKDKPSLAELKTILDSIPLRKIEPYLAYVEPTKSISTTFIFDKKIESGKVVQTTLNKDLETTEWTLSNGMRVILKTTDFKKDEIQFAGYSSQNTKLLKREYAKHLVSFPLDYVGIDGLAYKDLHPLLEGKRISIENFYEGEKKGIRGNTIQKDLETTLQLIHLAFSEKSWFSKDSISWAFSLSGYDIKMFATLDSSVYKYAGSPTSQRSYLEKTNQFYHYLFANPKNFTFVFSGNVKPAEVQPLIEKYLASVKERENKVKESDVLDSLPSKEKSWWETGTQSASVKYPLKDSKAVVFSCCQGHFEASSENSLYTSMVGSIFRSQIQKSLRGKGLIYKVDSYKNIFSSDFLRLSVLFTTNSKETNKTSKETLDAIKTFMIEGITENDFKWVKNDLKQRRSFDLKSNYQWVNNFLYQYYFEHQNPVPTYLDDVDKLSLEGLKALLSETM